MKKVIYNLDPNAYLLFGDGSCGTYTVLNQVCNDNGIPLIEINDRNTMNSSYDNFVHSISEYLYMSKSVPLSLLLLLYKCKYNLKRWLSNTQKPASSPDYDPIKLSAIESIVHQIPEQQLLNQFDDCLRLFDQENQHHIDQHQSANPSFVLVYRQKELFSSPSPQDFFYDCLQQWSKNYPLSSFFVSFLYGPLYSSPFHPFLTNMPLIGFAPLDRSMYRKDTLQQEEDSTTDPYGYLKEEIPSLLLLLSNGFWDYAEEIYHHIKGPITVDSIHLSHKEIQDQYYNQLMALYTNYPIRRDSPSTYHIALLNAFYSHVISLEEATQLLPNSYSIPVLLEYIYRALTVPSSTYNRYSGIRMYQSLIEGSGSDLLVGIDRQLSKYYQNQDHSEANQDSIDNIVYLIPSMISLLIGSQFFTVHLANAIIIDANHDSYNTLLSSIQFCVHPFYSYGISKMMEDKELWTSLTQQYSSVIQETSSLFWSLTLIQVEEQYNYLTTLFKTTRNVIEQYIEYQTQLKQTTLSCTIIELDNLAVLFEVQVQNLLKYLKGLPQSDEFDSLYEELDTLSMNIFNTHMEMVHFLQQNMSNLNIKYKE